MSHLQKDSGGPSGLRAIKVKVERWRGKESGGREKSGAAGDYRDTHLMN